MKWIADDSFEGFYKLTCLIPDKWGHLISSLCLFLILYVLGFSVGWAGLYTLWAGFIWEVIDIFTADGFSWRDLVADFMGILTGFILIIIGG